MKAMKLLSIIIIVLGVIACGGGSDGTVKVETNTYKGEVTNDGVTITDIKTTDTDVTIPAEIEGIPVTAIGDGAFQGNTNVESVTLPSSITEIGDDAFRGCENLESVTIPPDSAMESIGDRAFQDCPSLGSFEIPDGVTSIGEGLFMGTAISSITVPGSVQTIGKDAFKDLTGLTTVTLDSPSSLQTIGDGAFQNTGISSITIPENVQSIGEGAFMGTAISSITVPGSVQTIGKDAFKDLTGLTTVTLGSPSSLQTIGDGAFQNTGIASTDGARFVIPDGVTSIGDYAFAGTGTALEVITLPDGLLSLGEGVFKGRSGLYIADLPSSVTQIGAEAFQETSITSITIPDGVTHIPDRCFQLTALSSVTINDSSSLQTMGIAAFENCSLITSINIPQGVTSIGTRAFNLTGLTAVTVRAENPPELGDMVFVIADPLELEVPNGKYDAYTASAWNGYFTTITETPAP